MPRPYTQSRSCGNFDEENYIIPIIGDADGLLTVTERSYTYLLRNANPDLCPSKFPRSTVDKVFHFMIRRLRRDRNTNTKQVKDYGVQKYLALLTDVEKKVRYEFSSLPNVIYLSPCVRSVLKISWPTPTVEVLCFLEFLFNFRVAVPISS